MPLIPPEFAQLFETASEWTDKHAGLAGWVGAIGSILAVFVAWWIARAEYLRTKRKNAARQSREIDLILRIISEFEKQVQKCLKLVAAGASQATSFYDIHMNDPEWHSMTDLAHLPVTHWPSLETYGTFKQYWYNSIRLVQGASTTNDNKHELMQEWKQAHDESLPPLIEALKSAQRG